MKDTILNYMKAAWLEYYSAQPPDGSVGGDSARLNRCMDVLALRYGIRAYDATMATCGERFDPVYLRPEFAK